MDLLNIKSLRPGADGRSRQAPYAANYDESKANPSPVLPDPLVLKNGQKVTTADMWWNQRRPEIVEDFDREIYGRMPATLPAVNWEVTSTTTRRMALCRLSSRSLSAMSITPRTRRSRVNIQLTLTTPKRQRRCR